MNTIEINKIVKYELVLKETIDDSIQIFNYKDVINYYRSLFKNSINVYESLFLITIDNSNYIKGIVKISQGGVSSCLVDVKLICKYAIESLSSAVILIHNHPSGLLKASEEDIKITNKIKKALSYIDTELIDHFIITDKGYTSVL